MALKIEDIRKISIGEGEALCILESAVKNYDFIDKIAEVLGCQVFLVDNFEDFQVVSVTKLKEKVV